MYKGTVNNKFEMSTTFIVSEHFYYNEIYRIPYIVVACWQYTYQHIIHTQQHHSTKHMPQIIK